ncbi:hypothetical protein QE379_001962 [Sphingomonas sp. SORGH_AS 879]|nr:hypothetical protein [Sphingomonas sp. SORGH_AS_0879]
MKMASLPITDGPCSISVPRHRREHRDRGDAHDVVGDLQHDGDQRIDRADQRRGALADRRDRNAQEERADDDLQHFVGRHRLDQRGGDEVGDEFLKIEPGLHHAAIGGDGGQRQVQADARLQQVD